MSRYDSFFESTPDQALQKRILQAAQPELALNRRARRQSLWLNWVIPALVSCAAFLIIFNFYSSFYNPETTGSSDTVAAQFSEEQTEILEHLIEDEETLDMLDSMTLLEEIEYLDEESEGHDA